MNKILAAILLATAALANTASAEPRSRQIQFMCGSYEDADQTVKKYGEVLVLATQSPNELYVNLLYVNFETETSSWFVHDLTTDEYCMMGVGKKVYIPDGSPLNQGTGLGVKTLYN
jgi:hypothetical protein